MHSIRFLSILLLSLLALHGVYGGFASSYKEGPSVATKPPAQVDRQSGMYGNFDARKSTPEQILAQFGMDQVIPSLTLMLNQADHIFRITRDKRYMVNHVLGALKESFLKTIDAVRNAPNMPQTIDEDMADTAFNVWLQHFHAILKKDPDVDSDKMEFFFHEYVNSAFFAVRDGYKFMVGKGVSLTWPILIILSDAFISKLPTDVIDQEMFKDVFEVPDHLKELMHNTLAEIMTSDYGHFLKMGAMFMSRFFEKTEL